MEFRRHLSHTEGMHGEPGLEEFDARTDRFQARCRSSDRKGRVEHHSSFSLTTIHDRARGLGEPWMSDYEKLYFLASMHAHDAPGAVLHSVFLAQYRFGELREREHAALVAYLSMEALVSAVHVLGHHGFIAT